jgi:DNA-directed RNA polymerase II subunit RPB2
MDTPIPKSDCLSADLNEIKELTKRYVNEINERLKSERLDFKTESNDLFGFNGSNIDIDSYTKIYHKYQAEMGLSRNLIEIFDDWLLNRLPQQIMGREKETEDGTIRRFDNVTFVPPFMIDKSVNRNRDYPESNRRLLDLLLDDNMVPMYPRDAINIRDTYSVTVYVDVYTEPKDLTTEEDRNTFRVRLFKRMEIGKIPILKGSHFCWLKGLTDSERAQFDECFNDPFGYFIIKGGEKASLPEKKQASSQMLINVDAKKGVPRIFMYGLTSTASLLVHITADPKNNYIFKTNFHESKEDIPTFMIFLTLQLMSDSDGLKATKKSLTQYASDFFMDDLMPLIKSFAEEEDQDRVSYQLLSSISDAINRVQELSAANPNANPRELILNYIKSFDKEKIVASRRSAARMESKDLISKIRNTIFGTIVVNDPSSNEDFVLRKIMLAKMASIFARVLAGVRPQDDRDSWVNNRVYSAGRKHEVLFNKYWKEELDEWKISPSVNPSNPGAKISSKKITDGFSKDLTSGVQKNKTNGRRNQITDAMKRETPMTVYSNLHRVTIPDADGASRLDNPRQVHPSQLGYICSGETPEGSGCGRVMHLTTTCWIAIPRDLEKLYDKFNEYLTKDREDLSQVPLMLNGIIQGWIYPNQSFNKIWDNIKTSRDVFDVCVTYNRLDNHIDIFSDGHRLSRPLLVVDQKTGKLKIDSYSEEEQESMSIMDMTAAGLIEFIHANELEMYLDQDPITKKIVKRNDDSSPNNKRSSSDDAEYIEMPWVKANDYEKFIKIAEYPSDVAKLTDSQDANLRTNEQPFTHSEIIPYGQFGIPASCIPAADHNHGPRITYQASMSKQALSGFHSVHRERYDGTIKRAIAPTRTFFETGTYQPIGLNAMPTTDTPVVAFLAHAVNNEDSIIAKKEFLDQHFLIAKYTCYKIKLEELEEIGLTPEAEEDRYGINKALWKSTDPGVNKDMIGLPKIGMYVGKGDAHLGRIRKEADKETGDQIRRYVPITTGMGKEGYIDRVEVLLDSSKKKLVKIKVVQYRRQIAGDKVASRYSQKGTFGLVLPANKMPRIASGPNKGVIPDFIINPHCIPSRMTQGKMIENLFNKAVAYTGERIDASPFLQLYEEYFLGVLESVGLDRTGLEEMVHPDGIPLETKVNVGLCSYQSLKHHVVDKLQRRDVRLFNPLTHQPAAGRINEGGLKFGEMEHDATVSHGTTAITADRLLYASDVYRVICCRNCGNIVISNFEPAKTYPCRYCGKSEFGLVEIPYILHLINRNFNAIGMHIHFRFD